MAGQSPLAQSCSLSLLQQPSALPDQLGVRCKSLGAILTTLPRKCEVTLTFPASHSAGEDKPLFAFCSFLVLEKHPPIPALSCLLPFQAKLAKQWLWWQCSLLNSSCHAPCFRRFPCPCGGISSSMGARPSSQSNLGASMGLILGAGCAMETCPGRPRDDQVGTDWPPHPSPALSLLHHPHPTQIRADWSQSPPGSCSPKPHSHRASSSQ